MKLSTLQAQHTVCIAKLILYADSFGYELTWGDANRSKEAFGAWGVKKLYSAAFSVHKKRLAVDLNLIVNEEYIKDGNHPVYKLLGDYWKELHPLARWGGDFKSGDANHFSFEYKGYM